MTNDQHSDPMERVALAIRAQFAEKDAIIATQEAEIERLREALDLILHCTPANTNFYDCGDPFDIAREALGANQ